MSTNHCVLIIYWYYDPVHSGQIMTFCWLVFVVYWLISAFSMKLAASRQSYVAEIGNRIPTIIGAWTLFWPRPIPGLATQIVPASPTLNILAAVICVLG